MKRFLQNMPIRRKQALVLMMTSGLALLLASAAVIVHVTIDFHDKLKAGMETLAGVVDQDCQAALDDDDVKSAEDSLALLQAEPAVLGACIYDRNGKVFASYRRAGMTNELAFPPMQVAGSETTGLRMFTFHTVMEGQKVSNGVCIISSLEELPGHIKQYARSVAVVFVVTMVLAFLVSSRLHWLISDPVRNLAQVARAVAAQKNYALRAQKEGNDEIGQLVDGFNEMLAEIQTRDLALQNARDNLERRVEQRTEDLQQEVKERARAQAALQESQALYHSLVEQLPMGVFRKDQAGRYVFINTWICRLKGIKPEEMLGKTPMEMQAYETAEKTVASPEITKLASQGRDHHQLIMETGRQIELEEEYPAADGRTRYLQVVKLPVFGPDGGITGTQGIMFDITARKQAEAELAYERDLFRALMDNFPDAIYFKDLQSKFVRVSKSKLEKSLDYGRKEHRAAHPANSQTSLPPHLASLEKFTAYMTGKSDFDFLPEDVARPLFEGEQEIIRTGQPLLGKIEELKFADGRVGWFLSTKMPWKDKNGKIIGTFGTTKNVTSIKEAEAKLAEASVLMTTLLANAPDYIYFKDRESRFIRCSASMAAMFKVDSPDQVVGKTDRDFFGEEHAHEAFEDEQQIIRTGKPIIGKTEKETWPDGHLTWALTTKMPLRDANDEIVGTFGISKDITPLKEAEAKLKQVHSDLVQTSRRAGMADVATSVLHNVGNVLNSVNTSSGLLADRLRKSKVTGISRVAAMFEENQHDLAGFLATEGRRDQIINYLKTLSQHVVAEQAAMLAEVQDLTTNVEHIKEIVAMQQNYAKVAGVREIQSASALMEDALRMHTAALTRHEVQVVRQYENLPEVSLDKHKVLQILINLISNAKYAMTEMTLEKRQLTVGVGGNGNGKVRFTITDNGVGIAKENLTRIFALGFTTRDNGHGFGLHSGFLSARELGGDLRVQSSGPGNGATFTLELPIQPE